MIFPVVKFGVTDIGPGGNQRPAFKPRQSDVIFPLCAQQLGPAFYFKPVVTMPRTNSRRKTRNRMTIGKSAVTEAANRSG